MRSAIVKALQRAERQVMMEYVERPIGTACHFPYILDVWSSASLGV